MQVVKLNSCLNTHSKIYGLCIFGVVYGMIIMLLVWSTFSMPFGIMASLPGYACGYLLGKLWHKGIIQSYLYWHLPVTILVGKRRLPASYNRRYI